MISNLQKGFGQNHHSTKTENLQGIIAKMLDVTPESLSGWEISYHDLQFEQVPITIHSSGGTKYIRWVDIGMPKIPERLLKSVFYLYRTVEDANKRKNHGGTGFFVGVPSEQHRGRSYIYGISNWHVVLAGGYSVIRTMKDDGTPAIIEFDQIEWEFIPNKGDVAISPKLNVDDYDVTFIHTDYFAINKVIDEQSIGVGDEIFMIGRFIDHEGAVTNYPSARFGAISIMPTIIKEQKNAKKIESYVIDMHSRTGYSGSPVYIYRTPGNNLDEAFRTGETKLGGSLLCLLGIHWGQFPEYWEIVDNKKMSKSKKEFIKGISGMTCVLPAQNILDLLNIDKFKKQRKLGDIELQERFIKYGFPPEPELASIELERDIIPDNPQHKEDFTSIVRAAAKKKPLDDKT
jgi:hypothetical protein